MAYYDGDTLKDKLAKGPMSIQDILRLARQVGEGLDKAHEKGIVHRDIKPANIIFTDEGDAKIVDFGLAKLSDRSYLTSAGTAIGTLHYMSPEQVQSGEVDGRTDIWSVGVVLYEMVTGRLPFTQEYAHAIMCSIVNEEPKAIQELRKDIPPELAGIIEKALTKKVAARYQSFAELLTDLKEIESRYSTSHLRRASFRFKTKRRVKRLVMQGVAATAVLLAGLSYFLWESQEVEATPVSIAVLPLKSMGEISDQEWFADSMTDAMITDLARIGGMRVISQSAMRKYKNTDMSIPEIGRELNAHYIIDGSVIRVDNDVRLAARLINAGSNESIWAENYQRAFRNILQLQAEVARTVAEQVQIKLTPTEQERFGQAKEVDPAAYAAYLRGRYLSRLGSFSLKSLEQFETAIKLAPEFAASYAGLADAYVSASAGAVIPPAEGLSKAKALALQALDIDSTSSEAYSALGYAGLLLDRDWQATGKKLLKAIELNPSNRVALQWYSIYLTARARHEEAIAIIDEAVRLDPLAPLTRGLEGLTYYYARDYERAIKIYRESLMTHPGSAITYYWLSAAQTELRQYDEATKNILLALQLDPDDPVRFMRDWLGKLYADTG